MSSWPILTDVHSMMFAAKGPAFVEAIEVQPFDLAGRLVYDAEEPGQTINRNTQNGPGEYLATGTYLYEM